MFFFDARKNTVFAEVSGHSGILMSHDHPHLGCYGPPDPSIKSTTKMGDLIVPQLGKITKHKVFGDSLG